MPPRSSILIPSFCRPDALGKCLGALERQATPADEIIVVWQDDDRRTLEAAEAAGRSARTRLRTIHSPTRGVVPAENAALDASSGEVVLLIDDDAVAPPDWVERHLKHYEDPTIGAVGGPAVNYRPDGTLFPTREVEPIGTLSRAGRTRGNMHDHPRQWRTRAPIEVDHLVGYNMSLRRSAFDRFEQNLRPYWQMFEMEACLQAKSRGFRVLFDFANVVEHHPTNTTYAGGRGGDLQVKVYNAAYNHSYILAKHRRSFWQGVAQSLFALAIGSTSSPGLASALAGAIRYGNPGREAAIFWKTWMSRRRGEIDARSGARDGEDKMSARRRILSIAHSYVVALNRRLAHELAVVGKDRWEVTAVAPRFFHGTRDLRPVHFRAENDGACRVEVIDAKSTEHVHLFHYGKAIKELLGGGWDLVHAWEEPFVVAGGQIAFYTRPRTPLVFATFQNLPKRYPPPFNLIERYSMKRASGWIAFGETIRAALADRPGYRERPMRVIPPGIDLQVFRPDAQAARSIRRELGWDQAGPPVIGFLGRFTQEKGVRCAMVALSQLKGPWRALFVGVGPLEHELRHWAEQFGDRVRVCTSVGHSLVPMYLNAMDVLIAPSLTTPRWREQFGRMLIEAFACGVPVVGSDSGEIPHVIGGAGQIVREGDIDAWRRSLDELLQDNSKRREMSEAGLQRVHERFGWGTIARQYLDFFHEQLESRRAEPQSTMAWERRAPALVAPRVEVAPPRRLLSIAHSYVVAMNRRLVHEMIRQGAGRWDVMAVAPSYFHGAQDLRPLHFEPLANEACRVEVVPTHMTRFVHVFSYSRKLKRVLRDGGWDFVHAWEEPYIWVGGQIARWTPDGVPLVYRTAQSLNKFYPPPFSWIEKYNMERASGWICSGTLVAQVLGARPMYARRPMRLIPLGVDLEAFHVDRASAEPVFRKLNWQRTGPPIIGYLGRFTESKGLSLLMTVLSDLKTPWRAMLVGAGPLEDRIRGWARQFSDDRVRICTDVRHQDVPGYLNAMDVLVAPSQTTPHWREQFGRMLIEAFATGVPVVGSDSGEIPHLIGDAGVVVGERDWIGWGKALADLLESPRRREDLAQRGLTRAPDYSWPVIARRYLEFFDEIIENRATR